MTDADKKLLEVFRSFPLLGDERTCPMHGRVITADCDLARCTEAARVRSAEDGKRNSDHFAALFAR